MNIRDYLLVNLLSGIMGVVLLIIGFKVFDWITPKWSFLDTFTGDKFTGGSIVIGCFLLGLAIIIARAAF